MSDPLGCEKNIYPDFSRAVYDLSCSRMGISAIAVFSLERMMRLTGASRGLFIEKLENGFLRRLHACGFSNAAESEIFMDLAVRSFGGKNRRGTRAMEGAIIVPLVFENSAAGIIVLGGMFGEQMNPAKTAMLESLALHASAVLNSIRLRSRSCTDPLTKLFNRGYFDERFAEEINIAGKNSIPVSLVMMDIDFFKKINDMHGHTAGDRVLNHVAGIIGRHTGNDGIAARYGGEEFACILPGRRLADAGAFGERLRAEISSTDFFAGNAPVPVTISAGAAEFTGLADGSGTREIIDCADKNLYRAKNSGRNRVIF